MPAKRMRSLEVGPGPDGPGELRAALVAEALVDDWAWGVLGRIEARESIFLKQKKSVLQRRQ